MKKENIITRIIASIIEIAEALLVLCTLAIEVMPWRLIAAPSSLTDTNYRVGLRLNIRTEEFIHSTFMRIPLYSKKSYIRVAKQTDVRIICYLHNLRLFERIIFE